LLAAGFLPGLQLPVFALVKKKGVSLQADVMSCLRSPWIPLPMITLDCKCL